jgi:ArsR family transcriptional regulator, arsenate/arsenite/antimonite-responsive transcriptional repressor
VTKKSLAQQELDEFDKVFKALAHPTRRHIIVVLRSREDEISVGEIVGRFTSKWPTITRHIQQLQKAGLVSVRKEGNQHFYRLEKEKMTRVLDNWNQWFK